MTMTRVIPPEAEGTISTTPDGRAVLRFERHLRHSVDRVWAAVSGTDIVAAIDTSNASIIARTEADLSPAPF